MASIKKIVVLLLFSSFIARGCEISWHEIQSDSFVPRRSQEQSEIYKKHIAEFTKNQKTPEQQVLQDIFHLDESAARSCLSGLCDQNYKLVINSFPYCLEKEITHLLMFSNKKTWDSDLLKAKAEELLKKQVPELLNKSFFDIIIFVNEPGNRTVKALSHSHIFVRQKTPDVKTSDIIKYIPYSNPDQRQH